VEAALGNASRILPVITTAHGASGSNNSYWPEMYMNMPIVDPNRAQPYRDTPDPKVFGTVGAFDLPPAPPFKAVKLTSDFSFFY
jgi:hypothetical protein